MEPVATDAEVARRPGYRVTGADLEAFEHRLARHGWSGPHRRRDGRQTLLSLDGQEAAGARLVASLDFNPTSEGVCVSPWVGVQHDTVNELHDRFLGRAPGRSTTLGRSVADLAPRDGYSPHTRWRYTAERPAGDVAQVVADDIDRYGIPEMLPLLSLDGLIEHLSAGPLHQQSAGLLATACGVAGRPERARAALEAYATEAAGQRGPLADQSWRFVRAFVEHFQLDPASLPFTMPAGSA